MFCFFVKMVVFVESLNRLLIAMAAVSFNRARSTSELLWAAAI